MRRHGTDEWELAPLWIINGEKIRIYQEREGPVWKWWEKVQAGLALGVIGMKVMVYALLL